MADEEGNEVDDDRVRDIIESSLVVLGAGAGTAVGGPWAGAALSEAARRVGLEVYDRLLVWRQRMRVGATLGYMAADAEELANQGALRRGDGFFNQDETGRSAADELCEAVLLSAADSFQEKKLRHLGAILPAASVRVDVAAADALWICRVVDRLSWRQLTLIALLLNPPTDQLVLRDVQKDEGRERRASGAFMSEVEELTVYGLLDVLDANGEPQATGQTWGTISGIWGAGTARWTLSREGRLLSELSRLDDVAPPDLARVTEELLS